MNDKETCPKCGAELLNENGSLVCTDCEKVIVEFGSPEWFDRVEPVEF